jgi:hypothetical protein
MEIFHMTELILLGAALFSTVVSAFILNRRFALLPAGAVGRKRRR